MGDRTKAEALRLAKLDLERRGWKYSAVDIGEIAAIIVNAMNKNIEDTTND